MFFSLLSFVDVFDVFVDYFVYGSVAYVVVFFLIHLAIAFLALIDEYQSSESDFYQQAKDLMNSSDSEKLELITAL